MTRDPDPVLVLHGGAGVREGHDYTRPAAFMRELLARGSAMLADGVGALDLVVEMVAALEESGMYTAGRGSAPSSSGEVELDASVMSGHDRGAGAVAAVRRVVNPVRLARAVRDHTPHVMLAGPGAEAFAAARGLARVEDPSAYYVPAAQITRTAAAVDDEGPLAHGTVGAVALDRDGRLAAATSTGGTLNKLHGRVGDTPLIGAATWADDRIAVSCTGQGEFFIRTAAAHDAGARMAYAGASLADATRAVIDTVGALGGDGGLIAVDRHGNVATPFNGIGMKRGVVRAGGEPRVDVY